MGKKKIEEEGGGDINSITELAKQASELKRHDEAIELWQQVIELKSHMPIAYLNMSAAYMALGDYKAGLEASKKALHLDPGLKEAALNYSTCALCAEDPKNAILDPRNPPAECAGPPGGYGPPFRCVLYLKG